MFPGRIPPFGKHPKPKSKGIKPGPAKFNIGPTVDPLDVFLTVFNSDAGADSAGSGLVVFSGKEKQKLSPLDRRVQRVKSRAFKNYRRRLQKSRRKKRSRRSTLTVEAEAFLGMKIKEKLERLSITGYRETAEGAIKKVRVDGYWVGINQFFHQFFNDELVEVRHLFRAGKLHRHYPGQRASRFLKQMIIDLLELQSHFQSY